MSVTRLTAILSLVALATGSLIHFSAGYSGGVDTSEHAWGADDAYVSYRYAANLDAGHGLVFNPGERVEGYTNLLHVLLAAAVLPAAGADGLYPAMVAINVLALLLGAGLFFRHCAGPLGVERPGVAVALLAFCPGLWLWTASGMESILVVVLHVALWIGVERAEAGPEGARPGSDFGILVAALGLGVLLRADGFVWVAVTAAYFVARGRHRLAVRTVGWVAPVLVGLWAWRILYYGQLMPNTYTAKVSEPLRQRLAHGSELVVELAFGVGLLPHLLALTLPAIVALAGAVRRRTTRLDVPWPSFFALSVVAYFVYVGGDFYSERFVLSLFPLGIVAFFRLFGSLEAGKLGLLVALVLLLQTRVLFEDPRFDYVGERYDCWVTLGRFLGEQPGDPLLAVDAAGKIPFFSGLRTLDMQGLTDRHIAQVEPTSELRYPGHNKQDPDYVLGQRPDLIAAWVQPNLDLILGLDRSRYLEAGYHLKWMLNTSKQSNEWNVVDVAGASEAEMQSLVGRGYRYGVLARGDP